MRKMGPRPLQNYDMSQRQINCCFSLFPPPGPYNLKASTCIIRPSKLTQTRGGSLKKLYSIQHSSFSLFGVNAREKWPGADVLVAYVVYVQCYIVHIGWEEDRASATSFVTVTLIYSVLLFVRNTRGRTMRASVVQRASFRKDIMAQNILLHLLVLFLFRFGFASGKQKF